MKLSSQRQSEDPNYDICALCGYGGDLICCDSCPSSFHLTCLDMKELPLGDWNCGYCSCQYCSKIEKSVKRYTKNNPNDGLIVCLSCRKRYHKSCCDIYSCETVDSDYPFLCGKRCQQTLERLEMLVGVKHEIGSGYFCTFVSKSHLGSSASKMESREVNLKLVDALSIMDECFKPIFMDDKGKNIEMIPSILCSRRSNSPAVDYGGFFTVLLENEAETISVATIRIHAQGRAEMPFIGTRLTYRNQGMCRLLLNIIELTLSYLNVEMLVIPSASEVKETWISRFGFEPIDKITKLLMRNKNAVAFHGTDRLQKRIQRHNFCDTSLNFIEALNIDEITKQKVERPIVSESRVSVITEADEIIRKNDCAESSSNRKRRSSSKTVTNSEDCESEQASSKRAKLGLKETAQGNVGTDSISGVKTNDNFNGSRRRYCIRSENKRDLWKRMCVNPYL
uniref:Increased DNA methylation 1-like n=2 Tax=Cicer arietinum TaxID=3827 RepID=A0A3Q7Y9J9_CICAR|nr:increased DNA methylation 1-like [Cicer arietinum]